MAPLRDRPILIDIYDTPGTFDPERDSIFIFGSSNEERIQHIDAWRSHAGNTQFIHISQQEISEFQYLVEQTTKTVSLRSERQLLDFWREISAHTVYFDLTGFGHHVWAPLIRSGIAAGKRLMVTYVEPKEYRYTVTPTEGEIFDLSERIAGIAPIPGFASLREVRDENVCFIPLLGFEGRRFAYIVETVQPPGGKTVPIIGLPGFRPEYPFHTYLCNRVPLMQEIGSWKNTRFASANDPFSLYYLLQDIADENRGDLLKIAPIGTKPHALGAILFAITSPQKVELVYDHPIRRPQRTYGISRLLVYHISTFLRA